MSIQEKLYEDEQLLLSDAAIAAGIACEERAWISAVQSFLS